MADQRGQIPMGDVNDLDNANDELTTQDPSEAMIEGTEDAVGEVRHNPHLHTPESAAPAAQNGGWALLQQHDMIILMDQLI